MSTKVVRTAFDATLNPGTGKQPDQVTVSVSYTTSDSSGSGFQITVRLPTGSITKDVKKAQMDAYRGAATILGAVTRRLRTETLR